MDSDSSNDLRSEGEVCGSRWCLSFFGDGTTSDARTAIVLSDLTIGDQTGKVDEAEDGSLHLLSTNDTSSLLPADLIRPNFCAFLPILTRIDNQWLIIILRLK